MKQYSCDDLEKIIKGNNPDAEVSVNTQSDQYGQTTSLTLTISGKVEDLQNELRSMLLHAMPAGGIQSTTNMQNSVKSDSFFDFRWDFFFSITGMNNGIGDPVFCFLIKKAKLAHELLDYARKKDKELLFPEDVRNFFKIKGINAEFQQNVPYGEKVQAGVIKISGREEGVRRLEKCLAQTIGTKDQSVPTRQVDPRYYSSLHGQSPSELKFAVMGDRETNWGQIIFFDTEVVSAFLAEVSKLKKITMARG